MSSTNRTRRSGSVYIVNREKVYSASQLNNDTLLLTISNASILRKALI